MTKPFAVRSTAKAPRAVVLFVALLVRSGIAHAGDDGSVPEPPPSVADAAPLVPALLLTAESGDESYQVRAIDRLGQHAECLVGNRTPRCALVLSPGRLTLQIVRQPKLGAPESPQLRVVELPPRISGLRLREQNALPLIAGIATVLLGGAIVAASLTAYPPGKPTAYTHCQPLLSSGMDVLNAQQVAIYNSAIDACRSDEDFARYGVLSAGLVTALGGAILTGLGLANLGLHLDPL